MKLKINEDNLIDFRDVRLSSYGTPAVSSGTFSWSLKNSSGTELATGSLTCVDSDEARWQGTIPKTDVDDIVVDATGTIEVTATSGSNDGFRKIEWIAEYHGGGG